MPILVTGFGPYPWREGSPELESNATERLIRSLEEELTPQLEPLADRVHLAVLPVDTRQVEAELDRLLEELRPRALLMLGQAPRRTRIEIELVARNRRHFVRPDARGEVAEDLHVVAEGPEEYPTRLPDPAGLAARLEAVGLPAGTSEDAGLYLCNQVFYLGCHRVAGPGALQLAGFVHVPRLPEQLAEGEPRERSLSLEGHRLAVSLLVRALAGAE